MAIVVSEVKGKSDFRKFVHFPALVHKNHSQWVPPVWADERDFFNPGKNPAFHDCDTILLLARREGRIVGRIMGIVHHAYNLKNNEKSARFGFLECYDDTETCHALLEAVEKWAAQLGMERIIGPYGFSDKDPQGLLVDGFEHIGLIASNCNYPYLVNFVESAGYEKEVDCMAFRLPVGFDVPDQHQRIYERALKSERYKLMEFSNRKQLKPFIVPILRLMNECYSDLYGAVPMSENEMNAFAARYLPILDPRFVKAVSMDGEIVSFVVGLPSISKGLQRSKGYLWPFGVFHILRAMRKSRQLDLMLGGVKPALQGRGLDLLMGFRLIESAREAGFTDIEVHLVLETNYKMLAEVVRLNADPHKRFRVYRKGL